jgi:S1-C subfamily serine protease
MQTRYSGALMALLMLAPAVAQAQNRDKRPAEREQARVWAGQLAPMTALGFQLNRPRLGVMISDDSAGKRGAVIRDVTDDSPAEKAGLKTGDIITRFNGTSLAGDDAANKLVDLVNDVEPGDTMKVEYQRAGDSRTASIVAQEMHARNFAVTVPDMQGMERLQSLNRMPGVWMDRDGDGAMRAFTMIAGGPMGLDLVEMNPGLGEYFGTSEGLLVTETPRDSTIPLRAGDVILTIDGRKPTSEAHARRILASYAPGETVKVEVMRKKSRQTVSWTVPERDRVRLMRPTVEGRKAERT